MPRKPWPHQLSGSAFLQANPRACLYDQPGMGKTFEVILALREMDVWGPVLVLTGRAQADFWVREIEETWPGRRAASFLVTGPARLAQLEAQHGGVYVLPRSVLNMGNLRVRQWVLAQEWKAIVLDESHHFRAPKSKLSLALKGLDAPIKWALSATPSDGDPRDYWVTLNWLYPGVFGTYNQFAYRYCDFKFNGFGDEYVGPKPMRERELADRLALYSLRRTKADFHIGPSSYPTRVLPIHLGETERDWYDSMARSMLVWLRENVSVAAPTQLAQLTRLRQLATAATIFQEGLPSTKLERLVDYLDDKRTPIVVATHFRTVAEIVVRRLRQGRRTVTTLFGGMADPHAVVREFNNGGANVLVMTAQTGGEGISLNAEEMVLLDLPWSSIEYEQVRHRIHRGDSKFDEVVLTLMLSDDTIDVDTYDVLKQKEAVNERLMLSRLRKALEKRYGSKI